ncbi:SNARE associated family protein [Trifolium pratense]|uniref:SNARE associated family protein n=1 Tax=Trifolium pratense TaxID=57577 RepID=A0A2K3PG24_TRIPR|nr:SNARE associated family protein [Trifolium pratense]
MSLLAGALFGVIKGIMLVVFNATAGASSCFFLSKLIGRPIVTWLWPEKLRFFQAEIAKRRDKLLNYMLFLRITPTLPNLFINLASPIVDVPFHIFFFATLIGLIPASYITVRTRVIWGCPSWLRPASNNFHGITAVLILKDIEDLNDYTVWVADFGIALGITKSRTKLVEDISSTYSEFGTLLCENSI